MKFDTPAGENPIDQLKVVGKPLPRIEGPLKTTGTATYAYEHHDVAANIVYGYPVGAAVAKGRITSIDVSQAKVAPGVVEVITAANAGPIGPGGFYAYSKLAGPEVDHYHQAIALVVAETFEQARAAAGLIRVVYERSTGAYKLAEVRGSARVTARMPEVRVGDFEGAFEGAAVTIDETYTTPDQSHMMMEPHATIAKWEDGKLTVWSANQLLGYARVGLASRMGVPADKVRVISTFLGGGFGGKGSLAADVVLASVAARVTGRVVKVALPRPLMPNNTTHRHATIQRVRLGATREGRLVAVGHEAWSGNLKGTGGENAATQTEVLYAGANRLCVNLLATLDLPEGGAMRAPGEASGMMALEIAMDELAEKLGMDPVRLRILNDIQVVPDDPAPPAATGTKTPVGVVGQQKVPGRPFSTREFVRCLETGAERFGWKARAAKPASRREGQWLIGMGVAGAIRGAPIFPGAARVTLDRNGGVTVETNMTDMGTGSYTIVAQTAAEMMGIPLERVVVRLGDSSFPDSFGGGGQAGAATVTAGVYAACAKLRVMAAQSVGIDPANAMFSDGEIRSGKTRVPLAQAARSGTLVAEDRMEYGDLSKRFEQQTFGAHFCEVAVNAYTGEIRVRRMLSVCAAGRILNPLMARSQVIGGMTMGIGAALMEELAVDKRFGFFVNHDMAGYEVPVHADVPHLDVIFIDEVDPTMSPVKAKGVGELGISGVAAAVANAAYNATGVRVREYPITLDKLIDGLPAIA